MARSDQNVDFQSLLPTTAAADSERLASLVYWVHNSIVWVYLS